MSVGSITRAEATPESTRLQIESELFAPYRGYCARKGIGMTEVVLEDSDVSKGLIEYINNQHINNFVVGATTRHALAKKFRNHDLSTTLVKTAPEFCAIYVISKGKAITVRSAKGPVPTNAWPPIRPGGSFDFDDSVRYGKGSRRGAVQSHSPSEQIKSSTREGSHSALSSPLHHTQRDGLESSFRPPRTSLGSRDFTEEFQGNSCFNYASDFSIIQESLPHSGDCSGDSSPTSNSKKDLEAEMKRLKLELKQTMDMYSNACKEAISAKQKAKELVQLKMEEARRFEEARSAEEAALAMAEMEKARCQAALEAAQAAQKMAEMETHRRRSAELKAKREAEEKKRALDVLAQSDTRYRKYSIDEIELATEYFAKSLKIGEGGYGPVFRACLDHTPVAIKVLRPDAAQGRKQFNQEVEVLSCIRHPNMVLLLGACPEYGCLVYEYMDNKPRRPPHATRKHSFNPMANPLQDRR
ncbi:uncharacterized protein A4U43_C08F5300 [Asparagus officinalis]|nr:uncharacterized protein A4U43_C08F5300 [Asparagus officinalis]